jgi:HAMP domain-containing protein
MHVSMLLWTSAGVVFAAIVFAASLLTRRTGQRRDLGTVSASWIAEHRASKGYPS